MSLSSANTDAEVLAAFEDAVSYEESGSVALAEQLVQAARILLVRTPGKTEIAGVKVEWSLAIVERELQRARDWLSSHRTSGTNARRPRNFDVSGGRD